MSAHAPGVRAYGYSRTPRSYGYSARRVAAAAARPPAPEIVDLEPHSYTYIAPARAYQAGGAGAHRGLPRRLALAGGSVLGLLLLISVATTSWNASAAGLHLSRYQNPLAAGVVLVAGLSGAPGQAQALAALLPAPPVAPKVPDDPTRPARAPHKPDYTVAAPPSISAATIDSVLAAYHSPAAGSGATFYDLGVKYGIDPAYALAFYIHESSAGTKGVARFTHGIGNIRTTPGYQDYEGYRAYDSYAAGIEDWYKLIKELYIDGWGLTTPNTILARYAPWGDNNNPDVYATAVKSLVDSWGR